MVVSVILAFFVTGSGAAADIREESFALDSTVASAVSPQEKARKKIDNCSKKSFTETLFVALIIKTSFTKYKLWVSINK